MSRTKQALAWLAKGSLRKDMEKDLGMTPEECRKLIGALRKSGYIEPTYVLTDKGQERFQHIPKTDPERLAQWRAYYARSKTQTADQTVASMKRSDVPNSVFALGDMHA